MDDLMILRSLLSSWDCEVTEWFGGTYTPHTLDEADILFVVPPNVGFEDDNALVGKGQHTEVNRFMKSIGGESRNVCDAFMAVGIHRTDVYFERIDMSKFVSDADWGSGYGRITRKDRITWDLEDIRRANDIHFKKYPIEDDTPSLLLLAVKMPKL